MNGFFCLAYPFNSLSMRHASRTHPQGKEEPPTDLTPLLSLTRRPRLLTPLPHPSLLTDLPSNRPSKCTIADPLLIDCLTIHPQLGPPLLSRDAFHTCTLQCVPVDTSASSATTSSHPTHTRSSIPIPSSPSNMPPYPFSFSLFLSPLHFSDIVVND